MRLLVAIAEVSVTKDRGGEDAGKIRGGDASEHCSTGNVWAVLCTLLKLRRLN